MNHATPETYPATWVRPPGLVVGAGGTGPDPSFPVCPVCQCYGGGGHGGGCPNIGQAVQFWQAEKLPGYSGALTPETTHKRMAADAGANADHLLRLARQDSGDGEQVVQMIEQVADQLAQAAAVLRVVSRWLVSPAEPTMCTHGADCPVLGHPASPHGYMP